MGGGRCIIFIGGGGDDERAEFAALPPSVLPDISPSRGEIDKWLAHHIQQRHFIDKMGYEGDERALHPISPLEGEMSGRTEGGSRELRRYRAFGVASTFRIAKLE
jgi:hypothetical protein